MNKLWRILLLAFLLAGSLTVLVSCNSSTSAEDDEGGNDDDDDDGGNNGGNGGGGGSSKSCVISGKAAGESCDSEGNAGGLDQAGCASVDQSWAQYRTQLGSQFTCRAQWK